MIEITLQRLTRAPRNVLVGAMTCPALEQPDPDKPGFTTHYQDGVCATLEDALIYDNTTPGPFRVDDCLLSGITGIKVDKWTAIPAGRYHLRMSRSNRFRRMLPELLDVRGFTAIRMHAGDRVEDTSGCIILGEAYKPGDMLNSRGTVDRFCAWLTAAEQIDEVWISVMNP